MIEQKKNLRSGPNVAEKARAAATLNSAEKAKELHFNQVRVLSETTRVCMSCIQHKKPVARLACFLRRSMGLCACLWGGVQGG